MHSNCMSFVFKYYFKMIFLQYKNIIKLIIHIYIYIYIYIYFINIHCIYKFNLYNYLLTINNNFLDIYKYNNI